MPITTTQRLERYLIKIVEDESKSDTMRMKAASELSHLRQVNSSAPKRPRKPRTMLGTLPANE